MTHKQGGGQKSRWGRRMVGESFFGWEGSREERITRGGGVKGLTQPIFRYKPLLKVEAPKTFFGSKKWFNKTKISISLFIKNILA